MSDLAFYDAPLSNSGFKARLLRPWRRVARKVLLPFFGRQVEINEALRASDVALRGEVLQRLDELGAALRSIAERQDRIEREMAAVVALQWDRTAVVRQLARLEDRLIELGAGLSDGPFDEDDAPPALPFPGLDRFDDEARPEAV